MQALFAKSDAQAEAAFAKKWAQIETNRIAIAAVTSRQDTAEKAIHDLDKKLDDHIQNQKAVNLQAPTGNAQASTSKGLFGNRAARKSETEGSPVTLYTITKSGLRPVCSRIEVAVHQYNSLENIYFRHKGKDKAWKPSSGA